MAWPIMGDDGCGKGCDRGVQRCRRVVNHSTGDLERSNHSVIRWLVGRWFCLMIFGASLRLESAVEECFAVGRQVGALHEEGPGPVCAESPSDRLA